MATYKTANTLSKTQAAYIAGLIDGEVRLRAGVYIPTCAGNTRNDVNSGGMAADAA